MWSFIHQVSVVQRLDSAFHLINLYPVDWIVIYPVDSAIQRLNNRGQFDTLGVLET